MLSGVYELIKDPGVTYFAPSPPESSTRSSPVYKQRPSPVIEHLTCNLIYAGNNGTVRRIVLFEIEQTIVPIS